MGRMEHARRALMVSARLILLDMWKRKDDGTVAGLVVGSKKKISESIFSDRSVRRAEKDGQ